MKLREIDDDPWAWTYEMPGGFVLVKLADLRAFLRVLRAANLLLTDPAPQRLHELRKAVGKFEVKR